MNQSASSSTSAGDSIRMQWVSTRPLRQPAIGKKPSVIACSASEPLTLPAFCCRCGLPTKDLRPVRTLEPKDTKTRLLFLLMGHVGHLIAVMRRLALKKIKVPICSQCWALHRLGILFGLASIAIALTVFMGTFFLDPRTLNRLDFWLPSVLFLGCPLLIALGLGLSSLITWRATMVVIYRLRTDLLYYEFWSIEYESYLERARKSAALKLARELRIGA
jgi:hypothetical protein